MFSLCDVVLSKHANGLVYALCQLQERIEANQENDNVAMIPTFIFAIWLWGLLSLSFIGGGIYLIYEWYQRVWRYDATLDRALFDPNFGFNLPTALLAAGLILLIWAFAGRFLIRLLLGNAQRSDDKANPPRQKRDGCWNHQE